MVWGRYGCQSHDLLAAKLNVYGLEASALRLIFDYLTNGKQRTKIDCHYKLQKRRQDCLDMQDEEPCRKKFVVNFSIFPAGIYLFKDNNRNISSMCEICLKLTIKTPERRQ